MRCPVQLTSKDSSALSKQLRCITPLRLRANSCIFCQADRILSNAPGSNLTGRASPVSFGALQSSPCPFHREVMGTSAGFGWMHSAASDLDGLSEAREAGFCRAMAGLRCMGDTRWDVPRVAWGLLSSNGVEWREGGARTGRDLANV
jgi:hypothetical protein